MNKFAALIFLVFTFLTSEAKDFYLTGEFNGWNPNQQSSKFSEDNGVYTLFLESISGELKITTYDWSEQFGCNSRIEYGRTYNCVQTGNGANMILPDNPALNITVTFDYNNRTVRFDKTEVFYLVGDFNEWLTLPEYAFTFEDGVYTLRTPSFSGRFKIATEDYSRSFGIAKEIFQDSEQIMSEGGGDMTFAGAEGPIVITFNPDSRNSGVNMNRETDCGNEGPIEYYNLQGVRVLNPSSGIYIKRRGSASEKILIR